MSILSSFAGMAICADYFGDELPLPLPQVKMAKNITKAEADTTTTVKIGDSTTPKVEIERKNMAPLKPAPGFDGLNTFETFVFH